MYSILTFSFAMMLFGAADSTGPLQNNSDISGWPKPELVSIDENYCHCKIGTSGRIVGGSEALPNSIPWLVSISDDENDHFCGGAIINSKLILTAAHCTEPVPLEQMRVRVGLHRLDDPQIDKKTYKIAKIYAHDLRKTKVLGDIAILELKTHIRFEKGVVEPGCFEIMLKRYPLGVSFSGWGAQISSTRNLTTGVLEINDMSNFLKTTDLIEKDSSGPFVRTQSLQKDSPCHGDSGGSLHYTENGYTTVEAVAAYVVGNLQTETKEFKCTGSTFFSRLAYYRRWFNHLTHHEYCVSPNLKA